MREGEGRGVPWCVEIQTESDRKPSVLCGGGRVIDTRLDDGEPESYCYYCNMLRSISNHFCSAQR